MIIVMVLPEVDKIVEGRMFKEVNLETLRVEIIKIIGNTMIGIDGLGTIIMDVIKIRVAEIKIMITNLSMIETRVIGIKLMIKGNILIMTLMDIMTITNGPGMLIQIIDIIEIMVMIVKITNGMMMIIIEMIAEIMMMIHLIIGITIEEIIKIIIIASTTIVTMIQHLPLIVDCMIEVGVTIKAKAMIGNGIAFP